MAKIREDSKLPVVRMLIFHNEWGGNFIIIINVKTKHQNIIGKNHKCPQPFNILYMIEIGDADKS